MKINNEVFIKNEHCQMQRTNGINKKIRHINRTRIVKIKYIIWELKFILILKDFCDTGVFTISIYNYYINVGVNK